MPGQFESVGAQPRNPSRGKPIHIARMETGLFTNRSSLHDPASFVISKFYGGYVDALIDGNNMEVSNALTLIRRPGLSQWSSVPVPTQVNWFYDWQTLDQGVKIVVDTVTSTFLQGPTSQTLVFTKSVGAGQGQYQGVADTLYYGDGIDLQKYILPAGTVWKWGIASPITAPTVTAVASGSASTAWRANSFFTTMGLTVDTFGQVWQLISVNADGTNTPNAQFGTAGQGSPTWNQALYGTTTETSGTGIQWKNLGQIQQWQPNTQYGDAGIPGTAAPVCIYDPTTQSIQLQFNNNGGLGTSGGTKPAFSTTPGGAVWDNGQLHWFFFGFYPNIGASPAVQPWKASTAYVSWYAGCSQRSIQPTNAAIEPFLFPPPSNQPIYLQVPLPCGGTSGSGYAPFPSGASAGTRVNDGQLQWLSLGSSTWAANTAYNAWTVSGSPFSCVKDQNGNMQVCVQGGSSGAVKPNTAASITSVSNAVSGNTTYTGTFVSPFFTPGFPVYMSGFAQAANNGTYTVVSCNATTLVVTNASGVVDTTGTATFNPWGVIYGHSITDGSVKWTCVGPATTWVPGSGTTGIWNLPLSGWQPPSSTQNFGGSLINSNTSLVEATIVSGKSGTVQPTWGVLNTYLAENGVSLTLTSVAVSGVTVTYNGTITGGGGNAFAGQTFLISGFTSAGNNGPILVTASTATTLVCTLSQQVAEVHAGTAQNGLIWFAESNVSNVGITSTKGWTYAFSYTARTASDIYNTTTPPGGGQLGNPGALGPPIGSGSGQVSTASPLTILGPEATPSVNTVSGLGSVDPQVDTITIWRTLDGGSTLFFLTEIAAPPAIGGVAQPWSFKDFLPDSSLNEFISAPINHENDPPPAGFLPMAYHFERIWGAVGNFVFCSGGPDVLTGNPNESFDPTNFFEFPEPVTRIVPTATGILVFLSSDIYAILGGPVFTTFFPTPMVPGIGLLHYNALDVHGAVIYMFTADSQFISLDPSGGAQRMGGPIADKLAQFNPKTAYVTVHESGNDNAVFISDGVTGWYRLNPSQFPNGNQVWSPFATIIGGAGAVQSIQVSPGVWRLLVGGIGANKNILQRDFSTYQDNGTSYTCGFTMGSINLVSPGQIAGLTFVNLRSVRVGSSPSVSYLLNEISGTFTAFPQAQPYPWQIYGSTLQPSSLYSNAHYFRSAGAPALAEHMQVQANFPAENFANEVLSLTIFGVIEQAPES